MIKKHPLNLFNALRLTNRSRVAFVGSGGKTTAISHLERNENNPCLISTTTHIGSWQTAIAKSHVIVENPADWESVRMKSEESVLITKSLSGERFSGFDLSEINQCLPICDSLNIPLYLECDGSRQLPLKFPGNNEPVIPSFANVVVVTCGLSGIGKPLDTNSTYNPDFFSNISGILPGLEINPSGLQKVLSHPLGGLKNIPTNARRILLLNQADTPLLQSIGGKLAKKLLDSFDSIVISSLMNDQIHAVHEPTAGIILAAGSSSRFGKTKQLLNYQGSNFITSIINSSLMAGLSPIIVVTGSDQELVSNSIRDFSEKISIVHNADWQEGQSSSIRKGIETLEQLSETTSIQRIKDIVPYPGSAIFLLADMPHVKPSLIRSLVDFHSRNLSPVVAPMVEGQRANPVLFDRITFPALKKLSGDIGGRGIFHQFSPTHIPWYDDSIMMDIDTISDYSRLIHE